MAGENQRRLRGGGGICTGLKIQREQAGPRIGICRTDQIPAWAWIQSHVVHGLWVQLSSFGLDFNTFQLHDLELENKAL